MAGPILSGGKPWSEGVFLVILFLFFCLLMVPETMDRFAGAVPGLVPFLQKVRHLLFRN